MFSDGIIVAPATATGGAITVIRLSGKGSIECCDKIFKGRKPLSQAATHTIHYGNIVNGNKIIDDVVVAIFRAPHSYTTEDSVEISIHGSRYILSTVIELLCKHGARIAEPGEFSARAFAAGRIDLSQAEAVADIIAADSKAAHMLAATQMRGGYSETIETLRNKLIEIKTLLELELDFSEEHDIFADSKKAAKIIAKTDKIVLDLMDSFKTGNAIRNGVGVAIIGAPNVGKSTLLNTLINDDRAMVSDIAGTTRDTIEESIVIDGIRFRFIDTAGIRKTEDCLEKLGIERTLKAISQAQIIISMAAPDSDFEQIETTDDQSIIRVINKADTITTPSDNDAIYISARNNTGIDSLKDALLNTVDTTALYKGNAIVSSERHYQALSEAHKYLRSAALSIPLGAPDVFIAADLSAVIDALGEITGQITSDTILQSIFSSFCIGK